MLNRIFIFLIVILSLSSKVLGANNINISKKNFCDKNFFSKFSLEKIKNIEINTNNTRRWAKNILRLASDEDEIILKKYKKNFPSSTKLNLKDGKSCKLKSRIRIHGDYKDHMIWESGNPLNSLSVKLIDGNILNVTNFKLFLPGSRNENNEIFAANFLRHIGYISPRTFYLDVFFNGTYKKFIFQEDLRKELFESLNRKHGILIEGDERFVFRENNVTSNDLQLARISNSKSWIRKGNQNAKIAAQVLSDMNYVYLKDHFLKENFDELKFSVGDNYLYIDSNYLFNKKFSFNKNVNEYTQVINSLRGNHSLSTDDIRFYYNDLYADFEPVYYDGHVTVLNDWFYKKIDTLNYKNLIPTPLVLKLDNKINRKNLLKELNKSGLNFDEKYLEKILNRIFISLINYENEKDKNLIKYNNLFEAFYYSHDVKRAKIEFSKIPNYFFVNSRYFDDINRPDVKLVFFNKILEENKSLFEIKTCSLDLKNCLIEYLNIIDFAELLSQKYQDIKGNHYLYLGNNFSDYQKILFKNNRKVNDNYIIKFKNDDFEIHSSNSSIIDVYKTNRQIHITHNNFLDRTVFFGNKIKNWEIIFHGLKNNNNYQDDSSYIYTGCVTFVDLTVENIKMTGNNSHCEDTINFINVKGIVSEISLNNSFSDALDADFSEIKFDKIQIEKSKNDCLDFSYGNYIVKTARLKECGDKSVSVGEKSYFEAENIYSNFSKYGLASKDGSLSNIDNIIISNARFCVSAYNKKQEFSGGKIKINNLSCKDFYEEVQKDSLSIVEINKSNLENKLF